MYLLESAPVRLDVLHQRPAPVEEGEPDVQRLLRVGVAEPPAGAVHAPHDGAQADRAEAERPGPSVPCITPGTRKWRAKERVEAAWRRIKPPFESGDRRYGNCLPAPG